MPNNSKKDFDEYINQLDVEYKLAVQQEELRSRRLKRQFKMLGVILAVYAASAMIAFFVVNPEFRSWNIFDSNENSTASLEREISSLRKEVTDLREKFKSIEEGNGGDMVIESRLNELQTSYDALASTVLEDPDRALTAAILREKQKSIENSLTRLEQVSMDTSSKVDTFVSNLLTVPIVGFFITAFIAGLTYFLSNIKSKRDTAESQK